MNFLLLLLIKLNSIWEKLYERLKIFLLKNYMEDNGIDNSSEYKCTATDTVFTRVEYSRVYSTA